ncbi:MAG: Beta-glucosidase A [Parcubacteria group bacterium ADurb.Bin316]|nr:MAG: Beta-glucosidase A [Parcubacteria group bacterium ADurb.Bin316]HOZ56529.1 glycoside hydrolase family 1 protein [bacterium]
MQKQNVLQFPEGFLWGAGTCGYQVEGGNVNDWSEWEKKNAKNLADEAKVLWQPWQQEKFPEMFDPNNYISGRACDFINRYKEDFAIAKELGHNAHRIAIEWSRVEPKKGEFDQKEIDYYKDMIADLRSKGLEPFVDFWHWPVPLWLRDEGGWSNKKVVGYFKYYAKKIVEEIPDVKFWITFNEPNIYAMNGYLRGVWPPSFRSPTRFLKVVNNLVEAHRSVYKGIKKINQNAQIGIANHGVYFEAYQNNSVNLFIKTIAEKYWNNYFLDKFKGFQDFIGLNYYFHNRINYGLNKNENKEVTDMGWEIYPEGIYYVLKNFKKYNVPIYITENGLADKYDEKRGEFIKDHLFWIHKAISEGTDVRGYLYWGLIDFFEWSKGFWPRFGLVEIDYKTQERKIRPSALVYADICKNNKIII